MSSTKIRELNDELRRTFTGGRVMLTAGVDALDRDTKARVLKAVQTFDAFDEDNDPHGEHDFVSVEIEGVTYFAKVDYYAPGLEQGSEDPSDPTKTIRVLTIMLAAEY